MIMAPRRRITPLEEERYAESMENVKAGVPGTTIYLLGNGRGYDSDDIEALWEHAARNAEQLKPYIFKSEINIDESDEKQAGLMDELLDNVRYEDKVIYIGREGTTKEFSCMVVKADFIDDEGNDSCYLCYIPLNDNEYEVSKCIQLHNYMTDIIVKPRGSMPGIRGCVKLSEPTEELALIYGTVFQGIDNILHDNVPTWVCLDNRVLINLDIPPVYKLEIYLRKQRNIILLEKIIDTFKDRCDVLEVGQWNEELHDYGWFVNDNGADDMDIIDPEDVEEEVSDQDDFVSPNELQVIQPAIIAKKKSFEEYLDAVDLPDGYIVTQNGVWVEKEDDNGKLKKITISHTGILVVALARTAEQSQWMSLIVWVDLDGQLQEDLFPSESIASAKDCLALLESRGCKFPLGQYLEIKTYLTKFHPSARYRLVTTTGFYSGLDNNIQFALPKQIIGNGPGEEIYFQAISNSTSNSIRQMGTLADWQEHVAEPISGNPILIFALSVAFSSPFLKILGNGETGGFHLHGLTSRGKTTALMVAASVWGNGAPPSNTSGESFINTWRTTANALEGIAAARNDIFLAIDELGQAEADNVPRVVYDLSSGAGKERLNQKAALVNKKQWRLIYLSTGEISAREAMELARDKVRAGQLVRLVDIDIEDAIIVNPHGQSDIDFVDDLRKKCATYFGSAGPVFVEKLIEIASTAEGRNGLEDGYQWCMEALSPEFCDAEQSRVVKRFALVLLAGICAVQYGIIPLEEEEVIEAVQTICSRWLNSAEPLSDSLRAIEGIRDYLAANSSRFQDLDSGKTVPVHSLLGYRKKIHGTLHYLFPTDSFNEAVKGTHHRSLLRELNNFGLLFKNNGTRSQARFNIPGSEGGENSPKLAFYAISADILNYGQGDPAEASRNHRVSVKPKA